MVSENELEWPPRGEREMRLWQVRHGSDKNIAESLGLARASVWAQRSKWKVPALRSKTSKNHSPHPQQLVHDDAITDAFAGRTFA